MINIWYHQVHNRIRNDERCNCEYFINGCIVSASRKWKKEYISIEAAIRHFTSLNLKLVENGNVFKKRKKKKCLVIKFLKDQKNN